MSRNTVPVSSPLARVLGVALLPALAAPASAQLVQAGDPVPHRFILRAIPGVSVGDIAARHALTVLLTDSNSTFALAESPESIPDSDELTELGGDNEVETAEQDRFISVAEGTTQSFFVRTAPGEYPGQSGGDTIGVPGARRVELGTGIVVAVLDTGVSPHAMIAGRLLPGFNFVSDTTDVTDVGLGVDSDGDGTPDARVGHGTMVAGLVHFVAPEAMILPVRVLDSDGLGDTFTIARGVRYAVAQGAKVINLSLTSPVESHVLEKALEAARDAGVVVVASVGNNGLHQTGYPAGVDGVIAVTATDATDTLTSFSDYGGFIRLCAPGVDSVSLLPDGDFASASGTSFSAALVSGSVALLIHNRPDLHTPGAIWSMLAAGAVDITARNPGRAGWLGAGRLSLGGLLRGSCPADYDDGSGTGAPDGGVTIDDLIYYLTLFDAGDRRVDLDNGTGIGHPDGGVTIDDLLYYLYRFDIGC